MAKKKRGQAPWSEAEHAPPEKLKEIDTSSQEIKDTVGAWLADLDEQLCICDAEPDCIDAYDFLALMMLVKHSRREFVRELEIRDERNEAKKLYSAKSQELRGLAIKGMQSPREWMESVCQKIERKEFDGKDEQEMHIENLLRLWLVLSLCKVSSDPVSHHRGDMATVLTWLKENVQYFAAARSWMEMLCSGLRSRSRAERFIRDILACMDNAEGKRQEKTNDSQSA